MWCHNTNHDDSTDNFGIAMTFITLWNWAKLSFDTIVETLISRYRAINLKRCGSWLLSERHRSLMKLPSDLITSIPLNSRPSHLVINKKLSGTFQCFHWPAIYNTLVIMIHFKFNIRIITLIKNCKNNNSWTGLVISLNKK